MTKIISGNSNRPLAEKVSSLLNLSLVRTTITTFPNKEISVEILEDLTNEDVFVLQSTSSPVHDTLMELLMTLDTVKRCNPRSITAVIPYFGYSRQDRQTTPYSSLAVDLIANLIRTAGVHRIITVDLHSSQLKHLSNISLENVPITSTFYEALTSASLSPNTLIISPDQGGHVRAQTLAQKLNLEVGFIHKQRNNLSGACQMRLESPVKRRPCIIIDDIIDTAETLCTAADTLMQAGADSVKAYITHGVLTGDAIKRIEISVLDEVYITDSILAASSLYEGHKIKYLSIAPLLKEIIKKF